MTGTLALLAVSATALAAPGATPGACGSASADEPAAFGTTPCPGVRPGAPLRIDSPIGQFPAPNCTLGFMLRSGDERYMTTAGHCAGPGTRRRFAPGEGPVARDDDGRRIGEVAYAFDAGQPAGTELDLALIRLDGGVSADAETCHFGGPTGVNDDLIPAPTPVEVRYYGNAVAGGYVPVARRWLLPARTGVSTGLPNPHRVHFTGHATFVDSGAPVLSADGRALALIRGAIGADGSGYAGAVVALRLPHQLDHAEDALGIDLELATVASG